MREQEGFLDPVFAAHCVLRYYNLTVHSQNPDTKGKQINRQHLYSPVYGFWPTHHPVGSVSSALIKLGDLFYEGGVAGHKDMDSAAQKYKRAALMADPQVFPFTWGLTGLLGYAFIISNGRSDHWKWGKTMFPWTTLNMLPGKPESRVSERPSIHFHTFSSSPGVVQPGSPRWAGLQAAFISADRPGSPWPLPGR